MASLLDLLDEHYPDWPQFHESPIEAAVECGLLDEAALDDLSNPPLNFDTEY